MTARDPIAAAITLMEASRREAYNALIRHTPTCAACNRHPLCEEGRRLWDTWKGRDK
ncbi:hypothetical protein ACFVY1_34995 [Streptomyces sp. NPDC058293]|uniref:hypothetical protein n=1 Tax=Streptomyces sp. NPDC058293 TaxID=3346429 RepID=UPI0036E5EC23